MRDVARRAGCSVGAVHAVLRAPTKRPRKPAKAPPAVPPPVAPTAPAEGEGDAGGTPIDRLSRSLAALEQAAQLAASDKDVARMVQVERAVGDITNLIERLRPPPPVDPNTNPDMVAAAKEAREMLFGTLDRILAETQK